MAPTAENVARVERINRFPEGTSWVSTLLDSGEVRFVHVLSMNNSELDPACSPNPEELLRNLEVRLVQTSTEALSLGSSRICLESYTPFIALRMIPSCGDVVHKPCLYRWIMEGGRITCPLDNKRIVIPIADSANFPSHNKSVGDAKAGQGSQCTGSLYRSPPR
jgi:hypothetical protein